MGGALKILLCRDVHFEASSLKKFYFQIFLSFLSLFEITFKIINNYV
jgi:hypothetical protein